MTCDFTSFSTVFQSYQDNGRVIMKGWPCLQLEGFPLAVVEPGVLNKMQSTMSVCLY